MTTVHQVRAGAVVLALVSCAGSACRQKADAPQIIALEGRAEKIDVRQHRITATYYSEKRGEEVVGAAEITPETEILINGVVATLEDVREGDPIRGDVRIEKRGDERTMVVLKMYIDRPRALTPPTP